MRSYIAIPAILALAIVSASAQDIDSEDVPSACQSVCAPVVAVASACDDLDDDAETGWPCICAGQGMSTAVPECLSCIQSAGVSGDDDGTGDVIAGLGSCGFSAVSTGGGTQTTTAGGGSVATITAGETTGGGTTANIATTVVTNVGDGSGSQASTNGGTQGTGISGGTAAATPPTTTGPTQAADSEPSGLGGSGATDLGGSRVTVITVTIGSGDGAVLATLTSVVPGPVPTSQVEQQLGNVGNVPAAPAAAAAAAVVFGVVALL